MFGHIFFSCSAFLCFYLNFCYVYIVIYKLTVYNINVLIYECIVHMIHYD